MRMSPNKPLPGSKNKFYNFYKGKNENKYFFILPCIGISPKKNLHWDMSVKSIFFAWFSYFFQLNVCEIVKDTSLELTKECYEELKKILASSGMKINDLQASLMFIKNNIHIVQILRNSNLEHPYIKKILVSYFQNQSFIESV